MSTDGHSPPPELGQARARFLELVGEIRPELHRYCARLTGSVIEGEDIVQDTLAKAYYAISMAQEMPPLRPFLFRIAHNTAMDVLRRYERKYVELVAELPDDITVDERPDPEVMRAALATFLALPIAQRSAVILKDVLGCTLEEIVESTGASLPAVKAALHRGRAALRARTELVASAGAGSHGRRPRKRWPRSARSCTATRRSSTRATGRRCAGSSPKTAGSISCRAPSGAARRWANTSRATPSCATFAWSLASSTTPPPALVRPWRFSRRAPASTPAPSCCSTGAAAGSR